MKKNKLLILIMLFGFLSFGMSYSGFVRENVVTPILNKIANSEKKAVDQVVKAKTGRKKDLAKKTTVTNLTAPGPTVTITNAVAVNGGGNAAPGSQLDFTITINSTGGDATGITFQDILDSNLTFVPGSLKVTPIAADDSYNCIGNVGITLNTAQGVLSNDVSPDGTTLTTAVSTNVTHGILSLAANGSFTYNPTAGYSGSDSFVYTLTSSNGKTSTATVNITVTTPIIFANGAATVTGNGTLAAPYKDLSSITGTSASPIFIYGGAISGTLNLNDTQKVIGQGATSDLITLLGLSVPVYSNSLPSTGGTNPTLSTINLKSNNDIQGVTITSTMNGPDVGNLKVRDVIVNATGTATAVNIAKGGILDCIFKSISANGSTTGISVNKALGIFQVTGTGTTAGSGGTIQNIQNRGVEFITCSGISLKNINFVNSNTSLTILNTPNIDNTNSFAAMHFKTVSGVTLDNINITGTTNAVGINLNDVNNFVLSNSTITGCGSANTSNSGSSNVGGIFALNLKGISSITNTNVNDSWGRGFYGYNGQLSQNPALTLTVTGSQFKNSFNRANGNSNFSFQAKGTSNSVLVFKKNDFSNSKAAGLELNFSGSSVNDVQIGGNNLATDGNTINAATSNPGSNGLSIQAYGAATVNYNIIDNTLKSSFNALSACNVGHQGSGTLKGRINNNTIDGGGSTSISNGINVSAYGNAKHITEISNNLITNAGTYGILSEANDGGVPNSTGRIDATITGNTINVRNNAYANLGIVAYSDNSSSTMINAAKITGNTINAPTGLGSANFDVLSDGLNSQVFFQASAAFNNATVDKSIASKAFWDANNVTTGTALAEPGTGKIGSGTVTPPDNAAASKPARPTDIVVEETAPIVENQTNTETTSNQTAKSSTAKATSGETVSFGPFTLPAAKSTIITFSATINAAISLPANTCEVTNKATVSGTNFSTVTSNVTTNSLKPANPTVTASTQDIPCLGSTAVTLNATAPSGTTATWYTSETGGTSFATGATVSATPTANNTTYWVASETPYCASQRVLVKTVTGTASTTSTQTETACGSYKWAANGITYTSSGTYPYTV
ncbi:Ig-like domain-containing protein, partial [Flavobacterium hibernum]